MLRIGIDIGGTKTALAALDEHGAERLARREPTPRAGYEQACAQLVALVRAAERELGADTLVGIGLPGLVCARTGLVRNSFNTPYNGRPLKADLERLLGREVRL
ncbi:MAG: ROK family protein, partial [Burkholderiales bacterium]|nr:ROK family protein [Burkholderiales bacterium]